MHHAVVTRDPPNIASSPYFEKMKKAYMSSGFDTLFIGVFARQNYN
jgi:hypothetical protein